LLICSVAHQTLHVPLSLPASQLHLTSSSVDGWPLPSDAKCCSRALDTACTSRAALTMRSNARASSDLVFSVDMGFPCVAWHAVDVCSVCGDRDDVVVLPSIRRRTREVMESTRRQNSHGGPSDVHQGRAASVTRDGPRHYREVDVRADPSRAMLPAVTLGLSAAGGNTYQLPSSCLKKNNARTPRDDDVSTYTHRRPPNCVRLNLVTWPDIAGAGASHFSTWQRSECPFTLFMFRSSRYKADRR
jgi:hypothetical protein